MTRPLQQRAILGGTFDPVHVGHLRVALQLRDAGFDRVILMPNHIPPHRPAPIANTPQRLQMLELAAAGLDGIEVSDLEVSRPESSYSVVTLETLRSQHPEAAFCWVVGTDAWLGFDRWHRADDILELANLLVINRPGEHPRQPAWQQQQLEQRACDLATLLQSPAGRICQLDWPGLDISATALRQAIRQGDNIQFLTPEPVLDYIQHQQLYR
ncbi:nicotinate-nucleotide adenylyltransferase [Parathalassolituus penaei]|uniref:Probable nicotinate-nucleotide adenylyltransferase n=1 Tax=Parathalassolituus penaei TaxID=2997323 RepID=A0A9X3EB18_9GAMM|nr:nicotinate-nucleotide adenylyltransferase [Parathalassolituus penaei]MCY0964248.1 nicotinate-nucleotide adenylyltransferase [Parathalassolituus penaei]